VPVSRNCRANGLQPDGGHLVAPGRDGADAAPAQASMMLIQPPLLAHGGGVDRQPVVVVAGKVAQWQTLPCGVCGIEHQLHILEVLADA
jgi:hypothetical protein